MEALTLPKAERHDVMAATHMLTAEAARNAEAVFGCPVWIAAGMVLTSERKLVGQIRRFITEYLGE